VLDAVAVFAPELDFPVAVMVRGAWVVGLLEPERINPASLNDRVAAANWIAMAADFLGTSEQPRSHAPF
jgi:hypothetical protein